MKRLVLTSFLVMLILVTPALAQQAGDNVNVLPLFPNAQTLEEFYTFGDGYLQRQVEPTIAASTRNPDHVLAFFNDYRAVNEPDDEGLGESQNVAMAFNISKFLMAAVFPWVNLPQIDLSPNLPSAYAEAWVGMSRSYDGGLTWSGGFLPGAPFDQSPQSLLSPVNGLEAATDPVVVAGPCGKFYVVFVAFTRGDESRIAVARYEDLNNDPGGDTIVYLGTTVIETGNNAEYGYFLDKPDLAVDIFRPHGADECAQRVYVSYSTFNGLTKDGKFQSKITFAKSEDFGLTFSTQKLNPPYNQNQGSAIAVDPRVGVPSRTGGPGTIYLTWRHFFAPDAMLMVKSTDYGAKWSKPVVLTAGIEMQPFDQPTISTGQSPYPPAVPYSPPVYPEPVNDGFPETAFRSNGFPTAAVAPFEDGNGISSAAVYVAWQERVNASGTPTYGGSPRIVMVRSDDGGATWTDVYGNDNDRRAVDMGYRDPDANFPPPPGAPPSPPGFLPQSRPSGPQVMPALSFGGGRMMLGYYESRGRIANYGSTADDFPNWEHIVPEAGVSPYTGYISGYDRLLDYRAALLDPATGQLLTPTSTAQVSRYPIRADADLSDGENLHDVAPVNPPCAPDFDGQDLPPCVRQVNRSNAVTSSAGTSPFIGDYTGVEPFVQFIWDPNGGEDQLGAWRWATDPTDVPSQGFHAIWTDNRHLIPPTQIPAEPPPGFPANPKEWELYPFYDPPGTGAGSCINSGSRNTDVLTARVDTELVINAPTTYKKIGAEGASFPFSIGNQTAENKIFNVTITPANGSASFLPNNPAVYSIQVELFPFSSTSQIVYVLPDTQGPISVYVEEVPCNEGCRTGSITFNADDSMANFGTSIPPSESFKPSFEGDAFVINYNPDNAFVINEGAENAFVINPSVDNAFVINESPYNAFVINAFVINAFVINAFVINKTIYDVIDTTWTVTPGESTAASSFLPIINIDNAEYYLDNYVFQLIVHKGALYGTVDECGEAAANVSQPQILSSFSQAAGIEPGDAFVINPTPKNAFVINQFPQNAFVINSTFTMAPSDGAPVETGKSLKVDTVYVPNDGTLKAPRAPDQVYVTLRAYQINDVLPEDPITGLPFKYNPDPETGGALPSNTILQLKCNPETDTECLAIDGPDLVPINVNTTDISVPPCGDVTFPALTLRNLGTKDAQARSGTMRHALYISPSPEFSFDTARLIPTSEVTSAINPLAPYKPDQGSYAEEKIGPFTFKATPEMTGGTFYLTPFVDYPLEVSEYIEPNNWTLYGTEIPTPIMVKLTIEGSLDVFNGLNSPLDGTIYQANSGSVVPLAWQYMDPANPTMPIDSAEPRPSILITGYEGETCGEHGLATPRTVLEDPGSSALRYSDYTWKFNWQSKEDGVPLDPGCYEIRISRGQACGDQGGEGPFFVQLN